MRSGADFQQTCFARLRRLLCNRQPSAGNTSTPVVTSWRINAKIGRWLWFHQDWPGRCLQPGQVRSAKSWRFALSTHRGVLLKNVLPFGISSVPGYFQQVMDEIASDLPGVAVYLVDILCSGATAEAHLQNLRRLLERLRDKRTAMPSWEMHLRPATGGLLGARAVQRRNSPRSKGQCPQRDASAAWRVHTTFVSRLRPILRQVFATHVCFSGWTAIPSYQARSSVGMGVRRGSSFSSAEGALVCSRCARSFDPSLPLGIACDASAVGIGATLFHRYSDGSERPIANSKTLTASQRNYSQIQKEALVIMYALKKFFQYLEESLF